jgi:hypothetical protein
LIAIPTDCDFIPLHPFFLVAGFKQVLFGLNLTEERVRDYLQLWRRENGLTASHAFVRNSTKVVFGDATRHLQFYKGAFW